MATAVPLFALLPDPVEVTHARDRVEAAHARLREAGIDPASVPHAGAGTLDAYRREIEELTALGLEGERLIEVLAGPTVFATDEPAELIAYLESIPACASAS